jgi:hypothetical protein
LTEDQVSQILDQPDVEPIEKEVKTETVQGPFGFPIEQKTYDLTIKQVKKNSGKIKIVNIPPEDLVVSANTRSIDLDDTTFVARRMRKSISWLRSQGYKVPDDISDD